MPRSDAQFCLVVIDYVESAICDEERRSNPSLLSKQLGMGAQPNQFDDIALRVKPNQQEIALNVTFYAAVVLAVKRMGQILGRNGLLVGQQIKDFL